MLEGRQITYRYNRRFSPVIEKIDIQVDSGEIVGLFGPSGRGKTTLARILSGYLIPESGSVTQDGEPIPDYGVRPVQLLFQHPESAVNPRWKISRILKEGGAPSPGLLDALQVQKSWFDRYPHELSGGELQRICVARALGSRPRYIIADEITSMLDAMTQVRIWQTLCEKAVNDRIGILAISHNRALLNRICDRMDPCLSFTRMGKY